MPQLSQRAVSMQASPLRKLAAAAEERKAQGVKVYHLNIGQPDLETPQEFYDRLQAFDANPVAYANSQGTAEALDAWRTYYKSIGVDLSREELMVTTGGSEALIFALSAVTDPGDEVLVFEPFYTNYNAFATLASCTLKPVTLSITNGFHLPSDEEIEAAISSNTKAMIVCNPSNPTGTVFTREEVERLARIASKHNLWIIADEVYREFAFDAPVTSFLEMEDITQHVLVVDSVSKRFNACGARVGALVSRNAEVIASAVKFGMARLSAATVEQFALVPILKKAQEIIAPVIQEYTHRRDAVYSALQDIKGVVAAKPEGAFYIIAELPVDSSEKFAKWMIEEFTHEGETVLVAPAPGFYATPGKGEKEIRIAYVLNTADLQRSMELLAIAIEQYNNK